jgi:NAD(P)-dependent dehydrogenase (short-subunit alcohol dehydrogenase family)
MKLGFIGPGRMGAGMAANLVTASIGRRSVRWRVKMPAEQRLGRSRAPSWAVKLFTQALAREVGSRGITVNNVQPGLTDTDLNPASHPTAAPQMLANTAVKRYGHADEIAALVAFVAGPEAGFITGTSLTIDGSTNA